MQPGDLMMYDGEILCLVLETGVEHYGGRRVRVQTCGSEEDAGQQREPDGYDPGSEQGPCDVRSNHSELALREVDSFAYSKDDQNSEKE